ncbi:hypothetical protein ACKLNR_008624 [Fusarium oxysporum f. sp. zingiberi]
MLYGPSCLASTSLPYQAAEATKTKSPSYRPELVALPRSTSGPRCFLRPPSTQLGAPQIDSPSGVLWFNFSFLGTLLFHLFRFGWQMN